MLLCFVVWFWQNVNFLLGTEINKKYYGFIVKRYQLNFGRTGCACGHRMTDLKVAATAKG